MYAIEIVETKTLMVLEIEMVTRGRAYMTYEEPLFTLEALSPFTQDYPVFVTPSLEIARDILSGKTTGHRDPRSPALRPQEMHGAKGLSFQIVKLGVTREVVES
jgi:hypothetical protein